jgi:undecaprenyl-diphosphatase
MSLRWPALLAGAVYVALAVLVAVRWGPLVSWDTWLVADAHRAALDSGGLRGVARVVSDVGSPVGVDIVAAVAAIALAVLRRMSAVVAVVLARLGELGIETVTKVLVARPRPMFVHQIAIASGTAFPSGHAAGSAAVYGILALLAARRFRWGAACAGGAFCVAVAASRVVLGVHYPSDVIAGLALGMATAAAARMLSRVTPWWSERSPKERTR